MNTDAKILNNLTYPYDIPYVQRWFSISSINRDYNTLEKQSECPTENLTI